MDARKFLVDANTLNTIEELDDRNFRAQATPHAARLQSNNTTTDNDHLSWYLLGRKRASRANNLLFVHLDGTTGEWCNLGP
jgi:hypothetical protein